MLTQQRVIIEKVSPEISNGKHPVNKVINEIVPIEADIFADGHDVVQASVKFKHAKAKTWQENRLHHDNNDRWTGRFKVEKQGKYTYIIQGWVDYALNWQHGTKRKIDDGQHVKSELLEGAEYVKAVSKKASASEKKYLKTVAESFEDDSKYDDAIDYTLSDDLTAIFVKYPQKEFVTEYQKLSVYVDREKARFSTWYEFFPRSASKEDGQHGTFKDCERLLPRIAKMGFDTLYFPPVHPIGEVNRKGKNNTTNAEDGDVGSPWGIGSKLGGHTAIHPDLGTLEDFKKLVKSAENQGVEIAMDFALQAAPDHPWVKEHPEFFKWRPDGTVQYAENPPKKYQDIQPIYFETSNYKKLWQELLDTCLFWIEDCGIKVFRVDNPHTKLFRFWGWIIAEVKKKHPDTLFLSEAFTKPKVMAQLAKQGFTQSYTYFTWRTNKHELQEYMTELTQTELKDYFRPNFWPNTPDINPYHLQGANEAQHLIRYALAGTLSSNLGVYGPVFEYMASDAVPGKEEYLNSEKYQIRHWDWEKENKVTMLMTKINHIRKDDASLQQTNNIHFCPVENEALIAFYKWDDDKSNETLTIISLNPYYSQQGTVQLPYEKMGIHHGHSIQVKDQITGSSYHWHDEWNFVELHPALPFHIFKISR